jgi:hypothetical protein
VLQKFLFWQLALVAGAAVLVSKSTAVLVFITQAVVVAVVG